MNQNIYILKLKRRFLTILMFSLLPLFINCEFNQIKLKSQSTEKLNQNIDIDDNIENKEEIYNFINSIKSKDCNGIRKRLKFDYVYIISEVTHTFFFTRKNDFHLDVSKSISICDFFFNQDTINKILLSSDEYEDLQNYFNFYTVTELTQNANSITVHSGIDQNTKKPEVTIQIGAYVTVEKYPMIVFLFACESKSFSTCYLRESNTP